MRPEGGGGGGGRRGEGRGGGGGGGGGVILFHQYCFTYWKGFVGAALQELSDHLPAVRQRDQLHQLVLHSQP